ncbi:MAG: nitronate monooxygenase [Rhodospirillales bacterium]
MIETKLTRALGIEHPILLAPMDRIAGGRLAAAVSAAGGLGLIGGGYGAADWLTQAFEAAGNQAVGAGFITWSLAKQPELLDLVLARKPKAVMFSFGEAGAFVRQCKAAGVPSLWQVQRLEQARQALDAGTEIIVVQGQEAGGHGMDRGLMTLLPAVRDLAGPEQILVAAGGIGDGRGLAAALMLGADGVLLGTRFWAAEEAEGPASAKARLVAAGGDETLRTKVFDVARDVDWPWHFTGRVLRNAFAERWHGDIEAMQQVVETERQRYEAAAEDDYETRVVIGGEVVDLIDAVKPAAAIVEATMREAADLLRGSGRYLETP